MATSEITSFEMNFFRIAGTSEAATLASGKAEYLLPIDKDKKMKKKNVGETFSLTSKRKQ